MNTYTIRAKLTAEQMKQLKITAVEKGLSLADLVTVALQTSPHTKNVFTS